MIPNAVQHSENARKSLGRNFRAALWAKFDYAAHFRRAARAFPSFIA
jgi:hypothetical protein